MNRYQIRIEINKALHLGLSQVELARRIGVGQSEISRCCVYFGINWINQHREQRGKANHNFKDGLGRSTIERITRVAVLDSGKSLFVCERCNWTCQYQELPRHHKDRNKANNIIDNIEVLCWSCHNKEHISERQRGENGQFLSK